MSDQKFSLLPDRSGIIPVIAQVRRESQRCPDKCARPFNGKKSLTDIYAEKFSTLKDVYIAAGDPYFENIAHEFSLNYIERDRQSLEGETLPDVLNYIEAIDAEYFCVVNVCCPFLKPETVTDAVKAFREGSASGLVPVVETRDVLFNHLFKPVNDDFAVSNSKFRKPLYYASNSFLIFCKRQVMQNGVYFESYADGDPLLYPVTQLESMDIDTEDQYSIVRACYAQSMSESDA